MKRLNFTFSIILSLQIPLAKSGGHCAGTLVPALPFGSSPLSPIGGNIHHKKYRGVVALSSCLTHLYFLSSSSTSYRFQQAHPLTKSMPGLHPSCLAQLTPAQLYPLVREPATVKGSWPWTKTSPPLSLSPPPFFFPPFRSQTNSSRTTLAMPMAVQHPASLNSSPSKLAAL